MVNLVFQICPLGCISDRSTCLILVHCCEIPLNILADVRSSSVSLLVTIIKSKHDVLLSCLLKKRGTFAFVMFKCVLRTLK